MVRKNAPANPTLDGPELEQARQEKTKGKSRKQRMADFTNRVLELASEAAELFNPQDHVEVEIGGVRINAWRVREHLAGAAREERRRDAA